MLWPLLRLISPGGGGGDGDGDGDKPTCNPDQYTNPQKESQTQFNVQLLISLALGVTAYLAFCFLRPRWKSLYAARTRYLHPSLGVPALPDSFFGWILPVYRITDSQVLRAAGLDALCFLKFFRMAAKILAIMLFFALVILLPIYHRFDDSGEASMRWLVDSEETIFDETRDDSYLWAIPVFTYLFTYVTLAVMQSETIQLIGTRQDYLATQATITARTFMLSGIPTELRSKEAIQGLIENLGIGKVKDVTVCRVWEELDSLVKEREQVKRKLERAWASYMKAKPGSGSGGNGQPLLGDFAGRERPTVYVWSRVWFRRVDAIDYYQERLQLVDDRIAEQRSVEHTPVDLAFVTMDSIEACQMAAQAVLDPHPGLLVTKLAPSPTDVEWENTYESKFSRRLQGILVTLIVLVLTVIWLIPVGIFASISSICTIETTLPGFADFLKQHSIIRALVQTGLPTIAVTGLNALVPYFYEYLSYRQGWISKADAEMSLVSKNFFFIFFNVFLMFTVFGTVGSIADVIRDSFKDTTYLASTLAKAIVRLGDFYTNLILLNAIGILPFRLLQVGSVILYPIYKFLAKTPRELAELHQPDVFSYGFHLPIALFIFMLSLVYSVLPGGYWVLGIGLLYFVHGHFTYKYQLVYAMDQSQHADGDIWPMIYNRIMVALIVLPLTMSGFLALRKAYVASLLIVPLLPIVGWMAWVYKKKFEPQTRFIALRSIKRAEYEDDSASASAILDDDEDVERSSGPRQRGHRRRGSTFEEDREQGLRFVNPSLVVRLDQPWIYQDPPPPLSDSDSDVDPRTRRPHHVGNLIDHVDNGELDDQDEFGHDYRYTDEISGEDGYSVPTSGPRHLTPRRVQVQRGQSETAGDEAPARTNSSSSGLQTSHYHLATSRLESISATAAAQALAITTTTDATPTRQGRPGANQQNSSLTASASP